MLHSAQTVLITGATGFVGAELLSRLLLGSASNIVAPVRASSDTTAKARGLAALEEVLARPVSADEARRVHWVAGDLEQRRLGWDDSTWRSWAERVNEIYHCAASTNFDLPLEQAQRINVGGLLQIHAFSVVAAALGSFRRLHHVSTAYAAGRTTCDVRASETLPPDEERYFRNTYERTKARAERFLRDYAEVPWTILSALDHRWRQPERSNPQLECVLCTDAFDCRRSPAHDAGKLPRHSRLRAG